MEISLALISTETNGCELAGWQAFGGSCYIRVDNKASWAGAREACRTNNADLVVIETEEEEDFLRGMYAN